MAQSLDLDVTPCGLDAVLELLQVCTRPKADTCGGLATVGDLCAGGQQFIVTNRGAVVGGYSLIPMQFDRGVCIWIQAGAGHLDGVDLSTLMARTVEAQARDAGARQVAMITKRPALVRRLLRQGWQIAGTKMTKRVDK